MLLDAKDSDVEYLAGLGLSAADWQEVRHALLACAAGGTLPSPNFVLSLAIALAEINRACEFAQAKTDAGSR